MAEGADVDWESLKASLSPTVFEALRNFKTGRDEETCAARKEGLEGGVGPEELDDEEDNAVFKEQGYWDARFDREEAYDWLVTFEEIIDMLVPYIKSHEARILIVGCGNSKFSEQLYDYGYHNLVNIDFSPVIIQKMQARHAQLRPGMEWIVMDMTKMSFPDGTFDVVIDKASMDALLVDEGDVWDPDVSAIQRVNEMCNSCSRVLKPTDAYLLSISFAQPHFRSKYLMASRISPDRQDCLNLFQADIGVCDRYKWDVRPAEPIERKGGGLSYFLYVASKFN
jgi:SAM-dependent methyltransferase